MSSAAEIGVGVIGLGFMGQVHLRAYLRAIHDGLPCKLRALCDADVSRLCDLGTNAGNLALEQSGRSTFDLSDVRRCSDPAELFGDANVQVISICTPTDTHVDLAIRALQAGRHVLLEKPVATRLAEVKRLRDAVRSATALCMPAMCMRFWSEWVWLRDRILDQRFGAVRSATFQRLGSRPNWSSEFYGNVARSGGATIDLHIHDADFIYWCFGRPRSVHSTGHLDHITTQYEFDRSVDPAHVIAEGAWDLQPSAGFRMKYLVNFEQATAEFDLARQPSLVLYTPRGTELVSLPAVSAYDLQIRHFLRAVSDGSRDLTATLDDAVAVAELLEAELHSMNSRSPVSLSH